LNNAFGPPAAGISGSGSPTDTTAPGFSIESGGNTLGVFGGNHQAMGGATSSSAWGVIAIQSGTESVTRPEASLEQRSAKAR